ncbi:MAG: hypothetical protein QG568_718 [Patescibacteria group bacterium]|nr:hypothetical protein [Patescibacteria group bacterium]
MNPPHDYTNNPANAHFIPADLMPIGDLDVRPLTAVGRTAIVEFVKSGLKGLRGAKKRDKLKQIYQTLQFHMICLSKDAGLPLLAQWLISLREIIEEKHIGACIWPTSIFKDFLTGSEIPLITLVYSLDEIINSIYNQKATKGEDGAEDYFEDILLILFAKLAETAIKHDNNRVQGAGKLLERILKSDLLDDWTKSKDTPSALVTLISCPLILASDPQ